MENFAKDLVAFAVFEDGQFRPQGAARLLRKWRQKYGVISEKTIAGGVSEPWVRKGVSAVQDSFVKDIVVRDGLILVKDSAIASYQLGGSLNPGYFARVGRRTYYVRNNQGREVLVLTVPDVRSQAFLVLLPEKEELEIVVADKSEQKLMRVAAGILMLRGKL